ncbi:cytochrome c biogenesis protein ResB [Tepidiforma sp.]|uniref:cytochrome c biogenesis protein ResB n=1 Tax=Tepidiforma sp. TaxID=2682230 RepID=UPI0026297E2E|nr:cytochrome c biogenesis protein ResB [Tepidiforma sp.]MCX7617056.1 cytochrome c biogenesis protein ResB [Tepidiforma sp.]
MSASPRAASASTLQPGGLDPLRWAWQLLTNVKFALFLVGLAGVAGLIGTILPQMPAPMIGNPAAKSAWLELQRETYGPVTGLFDALGFFQVFHTAWFNGLWFLIIVAVTVCTVSRLRPTIRAVRQPPKRVPDAYFERAHHRASFSHPGGADAVERLLRQRRYAVQRVREEPGAVYLFADRYPWSQYGTFLSHLALLMILLGGLLTVFAGFDRTMVIAESTPPAPVFAEAGPNQLFIRMIDANRGLDDDGNIIDYHSIIDVRRGDETIRCKTTVNHPCHAFGYKVHQAAWFDDIARLRITAPSGQVIFDDILDFEGRSAVIPVLRVADASGRILFAQQLPQMATDPGIDPADRSDDTALSLLVFPQAPGSDQLVNYAVAWQFRNGQMLVTITSTDFDPILLRPGEERDAGPYRIRFDGAATIPATTVLDMPGATGPEGAVVQMPLGGDGRPYLMVAGVDQRNVVLQQGQAVTTSGGYTYLFQGRVEASGVSVRRDPGHTFIWIAVAMAMVGLSITFYVPRRRLWVKVTPSRTYMAGIAEKTTRFSRELRLMGRDLGARDALQPGDTDPDR